MTIDENIDIIKRRIEHAAKKSGRIPDEITLLAVTKTIQAERILDLACSNIRSIGENYVQEFVGKYDFLKDKFHDFHFIGHLQSNKVKYIIDKINLIHSVDSVNVLKEISKQAGKINKTQKVLLEVNLTKEDSKFGIYEEDLKRLIEESFSYDHISVCGLMTMPPSFYKDDELRWVFNHLNELFIKIKSEYTSLDFEYLSMGMSKDYQIAIEEGSNIVRLGSCIFGERLKK